MSAEEKYLRDLLALLGAQVALAEQALAASRRELASFADHLRDDESYRGDA